MYAMQFISGKANVVRRQFYLAHLLLGEALLYAQEIFGKQHLRYADCLMGKFNLDFIAHSVLGSLYSFRFRFSLISVFYNKKFKKNRETAEFIPDQLRFHEKNFS